MSLKRTRVVIGDKHPAARAALELAVESQGSLELVGSAGNEAALLDLLQHADAEVVVVDSAFTQTGTESGPLISYIHSAHPGVQVIVVGMAPADPEQGSRAVEAGAIAYLPKELAGELLPDSVAAHGSRGG